MAAGLNVFVNIGGKLLPSLKESVKGAEAQFNSMARTMKVRAAEMKATWRSTMAAASPLLGLAAAGGLTLTAKAAIGDSAELAHELQMLKNAGRTSKEVAQAMATANRTIRDIPTSTLTDNLRVLNETTMAFGNFQHAAENLSFVQKMDSMLTNALGTGLDKDAAYNLIKSMEMRGMGTKGHPGFNSARFQHEAGMFYQASIASGGKITPEEFFNFTKKSAPFNQNFADRFLYRIAPTLIQEQGGEIAGTQVNTFLGTILGKAKNKMQTEAAIKLGLLDPKGVVYNKQGNPVGWKPGAFKNTDMFLRDPLEGAEKTLIPALKAAHVDLSNQLEVTKALMPVFRDRNAFRMAMMLVQQQTNANLHKDEGLINKVPGVNIAYDNTLRNDPKMAFGALKSSVNNALSTMFLGQSGDNVNAVAVAMLHIANGINAIADAFQSHPMLGKGVGALLLGTAGIASLRVLGVGLRWVFSPLRSVFNLLFSPVGAAGARIPWIVKIGRAFASVGRFLGPLLLRSLMALAPVVMEGVTLAFALLSNPIGWGIILGGAILALGYYFRGPLMAAWKNGWNALKSWVMSVNWKGIGMTIANALTFGLAGKFANAISNLKNSAPNAGGTGMNSTRGGLAGARANGGGVLRGHTYLVGERGRELFTPDTSGRIIPNHHIAAMTGGPRHYRPGREGAPLVGELHIHGAHDPHAVALEVRRQLNGLANQQAALLSD